MVRLDRHILAVRSRLTVGILLRAVGWTLLPCAALGVGVALAHTLFQWSLPGGLAPWAVGGALVSLGSSVLWTILRRPTPHDAAVAIDEKLGLKEMFSTALYARGRNDVFAQAAVREAEFAAGSVSLSGRFPLKLPRTLAGTALLGCVAAAVLWLVPPIQWSVVGPPANKPRASDPAEQAQIKKIINDALVKVEAAAKVMPADDNLKAIMADLKRQLENPPSSPADARLTAMNKLTEAAEAMNRKVTDDKLASMVRENQKLFRLLGNSPPDKGRVGDLQRALANNDLNKARQELDTLADEMARMTAADKQNSAEAMRNLAEKLNQVADNPQARQELQRRLQNAGLSKDDAAKMADAIRQAAQGNPEALQNLQDQLQQAAAAEQERIAQEMDSLRQQAQAGDPSARERMNQLQQQQEMIAQQQEALNQATRQGLGEFQGRLAAREMSRTAGRMAQSINQGDDAGARDAMQQMARQIAALDQDSDQAREMTDAAAEAMASAQQAQDAANAEGDQPGVWGVNGMRNPIRGNGTGGAPPGVGGIQDKAWAPYTVKSEKSPSKDNKDGRILASSLVKAAALKGESKEQMKAVVTAAEQAQPEEVDQDRIPRSSAKAVRDYFGAMEKDVK